MLAAKFCQYRDKPRWRVSVLLKGKRTQRYFKTHAKAKQWIRDLKSTGCVIIVTLFYATPSMIRHNLQT